MQLEHNVHEQPGNMPILQAEHWSEHSEVFQDFTNSDSPNVRAHESPKRTQLGHSGHRSLGIGHTGNPLGIGHTGTCSDHEHGSNRTRHHSDVSRSLRRDSNTHRNTILLRHADPGELSPASMIRYRHARSCSCSHDSVSPRRHSRSPLVRKVGRRSHIRRGNTLSLLVLLFAALPLLLLEKEKENGTSLKRRRNTLNHFRPNVIRVRRSTRGRGVLLHLLLLCLLQFLQTLLLFFREAQPGSCLEIIRGLLLRLMTFLIPLLGLRVRRHTGIISVFLRIMMTNFIRSLRIIRT